MYGAVVKSVQIKVQNEDGTWSKWVDIKNMHTIVAYNKKYLALQTTEEMNMVEAREKYPEWFR